MLSQLEIQNFKIFGKQVVFDHLKGINFLTGINGRGKSTFLQSLLTMAQTAKSVGSTEILELNGSYVSLGNALDVKNEDIARDKAISFTFIIDGTRKKFDFVIPDDKSPILRLSNTEEAGSLIPFFQNIFYVSAERIGPQLHYDFYHDYNEIGATGEYVACALYNHQDDTLPASFLESIVDVYPETIMEELDSSLIGQVQFWLSKMFRRTEISVLYNDDVNVYTLKFATCRSNGTFKPTNVGFGFSYALPIVVAGLIARQGAVLIVENPEAHLHPQAQSVLGKFLALISQKGIQVFVETHSEHIINAARVMIAQDSFSSSDVNIMYFDEEFETSYRSIVVNDDGGITDWPDGFFDQAEIDTDIILGI